MKKIINQPENFVDEMLAGIYAAYPNYVTSVEDSFRSLVTVNPIQGKVGIATGGGSGHLPLFLGYVGSGMLDGCSVGGVFQSPSAEEMLAVTRKINMGSGVLYIYGNYNGDIFNFTLAAEMAEMEENIKVESVVAGDDIASGLSSNAGEKNTRRGVAGIFFVYKIAGAAASDMKSLDFVKQIAERASANVRTMGVALSPCTVPRVGHPSFEIGDDEMEIGMGIHGEPGIRRGKLLKADDIVSEILPQIINDLPFSKGDEVAVLINGLGGTPLEEQYIVFRKVAELLNSAGISIYRSYVGEFATSLEMAGLSISMFKLDKELKYYLDKPANTPFFVQC